MEALIDQTKKIIKVSSNIIINYPTYIIIFSIIIILLIFLIFKIVDTRTDDYESSIYGLWVADEAFSEQAELTSMMLFIGEKENKGYRKIQRKANLVMMNGDIEISKQILTIDYKPKWFCNPSKISNYTVKININYDEDDIMPTKMTMDVDICKGIMKLYSDGVMYAFLYKDASLSDLLRDDDSDDDYLSD